MPAARGGASAADGPVRVRRDRPGQTPGGLGHTRHRDTRMPGRSRKLRPRRREVSARLPLLRESTDPCLARRRQRTTGRWQPWSGRSRVGRTREDVCWRIQVAGSRRAAAHRTNCPPGTAATSIAGGRRRWSKRTSPPSPSRWRSDGRAGMDELAARDTRDVKAEIRYRPGSPRGAPPSDGRTLMTSIPPAIAPALDDRATPPLSDRTGGPDISPAEHPCER